ncbi:MAG: carotenoid oxygenase family protein, partial [Reyranella sp.]|nr:carotenoid oxygenase family protein [Reyranella sp.]
MAKAFPTDNPFLRGYYAPVNTEADAAHLHITGEMPKDLCGTLYRNGPNPQFAPRGPYHWFGGDGMIHAFHIENGNVSYKNRWVRTPKWKVENEEGEGLSGTFGNPRYTDPRVFTLNSTIANTNIVWHGGKLLALEEAHAPFALDPASLMPATDKGYETWAAKPCGPFTAHPATALQRAARKRDEKAPPAPIGALRGYEVKLDELSSIIRE